MADTESKHFHEDCMHFWLCTLHEPHQGMTSAKGRCSYSGQAMVGSVPLANSGKLMAEGMALLEALKSGGKPSLTRRGSLRTIVDGRDKFVRFVFPLQHNSPKPIADLHKYNDVELLDLQNDLAKMQNLALPQSQNAELVTTMNAKLNALRG